MGKERLEQYSLAGPENQAATAAGLAGASWFRERGAAQADEGADAQVGLPGGEGHRDLDRPDPPVRRPWHHLLDGLAQWLAAPFLLAYGLLYGSTSDSRWHESRHGTAFKTRWIDEGLYQLASFMIMRDPTTWRWSHSQHHTDTLIVGRDPEIAVMRPARLVRLLANLIGLVDVPLAFRLMFVHASGGLTDDEADYVPEPERPRLYRTARIHLAIYAATAGLAIGFRTWLPVVLIGGPGCTARACSRSTASPSTRGWARTCSTTG